MISAGLALTTSLLFWRMPTVASRRSASLAERREATVGMRQKSKEVVSAKPAEIMDVNQAAVQEAMKRHSVKRLIHGHTHRPGRHAVDLGGTRGERWVLPDWYGSGGFLELAAGKP